jgi:DNA-binding phage protein
MPRGKRILRDDINATIGFDTLGRAVDTLPKSLMRMFGPRGNPNARNLLAVIDPLQRATGIQLKVEAHP